MADPGARLLAAFDDFAALEELNGLAQACRLAAVESASPGTLLAVAALLAERWHALDGEPLDETGWLALLSVVAALRGVIAAALAAESPAWRRVGQALLGGGAAAVRH